MKKIIKMIENNYLLTSESIELLPNNNIIYTDIDGDTELLTRAEFINSYIDFLTDLLRDNRKGGYYDVCINITSDLNKLYKALQMYK